MGLFDKIDRSAQVMGRMAETLGVDFAEAIAHHPETVREYRQAGYCRNKDILEQLA